MTNSFLPSINQFEKDQKINIKLFKPTSDTLKQLNPHEKQDLFQKIKMIKRRNQNIDNKDPEKVVNRALEG